MTKFWHSLGPWHYGISTNCNDMFSIWDDLSQQIAEVERWNFSGEEAEREAEANAALIAAAPDLLIALAGLLDYFKDAANDEEMRLFESARAAIARATDPFER